MSDSVRFKSSDGRKMQARLIELDIETKAGGTVEASTSGGELIWTASPAAPGDFFVGIKWLEPNVVAWSWYGDMYTLCADDGAALAVKFVK